MRPWAYGRVSPSESSVPPQKAKKQVQPPRQPLPPAWLLLSAHPPQSLRLPGDAETRVAGGALRFRWGVPLMFRLPWKASSPKLLRSCSSC